ncbi:MAG: MATE family efflux transporter [Muribaculaceae bacterium]|nr:MATE family efflux transporter [Muribaculaceae bacterium]
MKFSPINREILTLSLPSIVTNITTPLLSLVDITIVGHMGAPGHIAAIALGGTMFNMLYWMFGFLRMGSSGMTAQAYGANNAVAQSRILILALAIAFLAGMTIVILQGPIAHTVLHFMSTDAEDAQALALRYFNICVWGAPAVLGTYALSGWFLGMQNSRIPMWVSIIINVSNITISLALVYWLDYGFDGVAIGTLIAQWCGLVAAIVMGLKQFGRPRLSFNQAIEWSTIKRFFTINFDIFLRTICLVAVTMWFTRTGASQGSVMLAANTLLMQFFTFFSFFMDGFAYAGEALCGKYSGARRDAKLRDCIKTLFQWSVSLAVFFAISYFFFGKIILNMLSDESSVTSAATNYIIWVVFIPLAGVMAFSWDGIFIGLTRTRPMLLSMLGATALFFIFCQLTISEIGNNGLWLSFIIYLLTRGLILTFIFYKKSQHKHHIRKY